ncbi:MAG: cation diffusion facilitator family transporter [Chloroflexi bacterium]|nr:cation diffusion facilitator family transporter [Chloroflexota bacterium]
MYTSQPVNLTRYAWLSIAAAIITILLKLSAYWLTNSVGLLSDALESLVNLATAIVALFALKIATRPADEEFTYGYSKIEYFSSGFEGGMILLAAGSIIASALPRLLNPQPIEQVGLGLAISVVASLINLGVAQVLAKAGKQYNSITLEADARHLMTDVVTTGGVIAAIVIVSITGWVRLDPIIALLVAANILVTGIKLLRRSAHGLMDASLPEIQVQVIQETLQPFEAEGVKIHALRTRSAAARGYVSMHVLVPGNWNVKRAHDLAEQIEIKIRQKEPNLAVFTHVEPLDDPKSFEDISLDRS